MRESRTVLWLLAALAAIAVLIAFVDRPVNAWVAAREGIAVELLRAGTQIGNSRWYLAGLPLVAAGTLWWRGRAGGRTALTLDAVAGLCGYLFAAVAVSGIATNVAKFLLGRARPKLWDQEDVYGLSPFAFDHDYQGFPSGHATTLFALAAGLGCAFPRLRLPLLALALVAAASRVAVNAHYPSDIVAGAVVGILSAGAIARMMGRHRLLFRIGDEGRVMPGPSLRALPPQTRKAAR